MWLAINEDGLSVLDYQTMQPQHRFGYNSIVTFGGCQDDFMMVVMLSPTTIYECGVDGRLSDDRSGTLRMLFRTKKPQVRKYTCYSAGTVFSFVLLSL